MMTLPAVLRFPRAGFWALHALLVPAVFGAGIALGIFHATGHGGGGGHDAHAGHDAPVAAPPPLTDSPIRDEMIELQAAYDLLNRAVVLGDPTGVSAAFHKVHLRKQVTADAIAAGTARPPRNADQISDFVARDEAFHAVIERVVIAADQGELEALRAGADELRAGCIDCHERFRGPTP